MEMHTGSGMSDYHGNEDVGRGILGYNAALCCKWLLAFRRIHPEYAGETFQRNLGDHVRDNTTTSRKTTTDSDVIGDWCQAFICM
jgi:hypothetical protein